MENNDNEIVPMFPVDEDGNPLVTFEVKMGKVDGGVVKRIFIDGELLDWEVDVSSLMEAMQMGPKFYRAAQRDIEKHFVDSVGEVLGRKVTPDEIKAAIQMGWI